MHHASLLRSLFLLSLFTTLPGMNAHGQSGDANRSRAETAYSEQPLSFEPNRGQTDKRVRFLAHSGEYTLFFTSDEAVFTFLSGAHTGNKASHDPSHPEERGRAQKPTVLRMQLVGAGSNTAPSGAEPLPGRVNYLTGSKPSQWRTDIPTFAKIAYPAVYPGVDLVYYGQQRRLEYDFVVQPHADPSAIGLRFTGASGIRLDRQGELHLTLGRGEMTWHSPVLYQEKAGHRQPVTGRYRLCRETTRHHDRSPVVRFEIGAYDPALPLVIDPSLAYAHLLGGNQTDKGRAIAVDFAGNAYVTGETLSPNFPTTAGTLQTNYGGASSGGALGYGDAFVTKLDTNGQVVFSTYVGGSGSDSAWGIALSGANICIAGRTNSADFPLTASAYQSAAPNGIAAFATVLNPTGSALVYSTYLGSTNPVGMGSSTNQANAIATDATGNLYLTGYSDFSFPVTSGAYFTNGYHNAFIAKLDPTKSGSASLVYGTYLGGISSDHYDEGDKIAVDSGGNAYVTGYTYSFDFPTTPGAFNTQNEASGGPVAFLTKINPTGTALVYSTFLNGAALGAGIALDSSNNAFITGSAGLTLPVTAGAFQKTASGLSAFIAKFNPTGSGLVYCTFLGNHSFGRAIAIDTMTGIAYVVGNVSDPNFPVTLNGYSGTYGGSGGDNFGDAFLTKINAAGSALLYSTYLGSAGDDVAFGVGIDRGGFAYLAGSTGTHTGPPNFPMTDQTLFGGGQYDAFVAKLSTAQITFLDANPTFGVGGSAASPVTLDGRLSLDAIPAPADFAVLASDQPTVASVNPTVSIGGTNAAHFPITLHPVAADTIVTISATFGGVTLTTQVIVFAPHVGSLTFTPPTVKGGQPVSGTVTLTGAAPTGGLVVTLKSGNSHVSVPATVTVPADATSVTFPVTTSAVSAQTAVTVTATTVVDTVGRSGVVTLTPPTLTGLSLNPTALRGGKTSTATVTLSDPAPTGGLVVSLTISNPAATLPLTVTVPASQTTATATVSTTPVATNTAVTITAAFNGQNQTATLTVQKPVLARLTVSPNAVLALQTATATVTIDSPAPSGGTTVTFLSTNPAAATLPGSVVIPAGATTASVPVTTYPVSQTTNLLLAVTLDSNSQTAALAVVPHLPFDFDNDGHNDLILQHQTSNLVVLWFANVLNILGGSAVSSLPAPGWQVVGCADFDRNGTTDLALQNQTTGQIVLWYMNGSTVVGGEALNFQPGASYKVVGVADFNGDGKPDLLFQHQTTGQLVLWYLDRAVVTGGASVAITPAAGWQVVGAADFNGDKKPDILFQNASTRQIAAWFMDGANYQGGSLLSLVPASGWSVRSVEDLDNDGKVDLVFQNQTSNQLLVWTLNGLSVTGGATMSLTPASGYRLMAPH